MVKYRSRRKRTRTHRHPVPEAQRHIKHELLTMANAVTAGPPKASDKQCGFLAKLLFENTIDWADVHNLLKDEDGTARLTIGTASTLITSLKGVGMLPSKSEIAADAAEYSANRQRDREARADEEAFELAQSDHFRQGL